jgi:Domain of unknown function DUF302
VTPALARIVRRPGQPSVKAVTSVSSSRPTVSMVRRISAATLVSALVTAPKTWRPAVLAAISFFAISEVAMSDPIVTSRAIEVEHVTIESAKPSAEVKAALESALPALDQRVSLLLRDGASERAKEALERGPELSIFLTRDHGNLLQITGHLRKALQYEIGNPLTASRMTQHQLATALYAPLRVVLYENAAGQSVFEYDRPCRCLDNSETTG